MYRNSSTRLWRRPEHNPKFLPHPGEILLISDGLIEDQAVHVFFGAQRLASSLPVRSEKVDQKRIDLLCFFVLDPVSSLLEEYQPAFIA
jgi:hypothetical protein